MDDHHTCATVLTHTNLDFLLQIHYGENQFELTYHVFTLWCLVFFFQLLERKILGKKCSGGNKCAKCVQFSDGGEGEEERAVLLLSNIPGAFMGTKG